MEAAAPAVVGAMAATASRASPVRAGGNLADAAWPLAGGSAISRASQSRLGLGWREELADLALSYPSLGFVELLADRGSARRGLPDELTRLRERGTEVFLHSVGLSLGGACRPDRRRLGRLADLACRLGSPVVSDHIAFVRDGGIEAGHLLPIARTRGALEVMVRNVLIAQDQLPVPLALENIAALFEWPKSELAEADFIGEILDRTGALLLLDIANLYANSLNLCWDPLSFLDRLPLDRLAYIHVAGGEWRNGRYHAHPVPAPVLDLLSVVCSRAPWARVMLERDRAFPDPEIIRSELAGVGRAMGLTSVALTSSLAGPGA
ncbi:MAG: DUF692 domain-containing protein [Acidimicrobiales bacterium]